MSLVLDLATEDRIQRQLDRGTYTAPAELINRALDLLEAERDSLLGRRAQITSGLEDSLAQADRGEGYSEDQLCERMATRRAKHRQPAA